MGMRYVFVYEVVDRLPFACDGDRGALLWDQSDSCLCLEKSFEAVR